MAAISATLEELSLRLSGALRELEARQERLRDYWHSEEDLEIVRVPEGYQGGMDLRVEVDGKEFVVGLPEGTKPGDELEIPVPDAVETLREVIGGLKNLVLAQSEADAALRQVSLQENELQERARSLDLRDTLVAARESAADAREADAAIGFESKTNELRELEKSIDSRAIDATAREECLETEADRLKQLALQLEQRENAIRAHETEADRLTQLAQQLEQRESAHETEADRLRQLSQQLEDRESAIRAHEATMDDTEASLLKREQAAVDPSLDVTVSEDSPLDKTPEVSPLLLSQKMQAWQDDHPQVETEVLISECNCTSKRLRSPVGTLGERQLQAENALATIRKLATTFLKENQLDDAEKLCREELDLSRKVFGDQDVRTFSAMRHLANLILHLGNFDEAISLHKELAVLEYQGGRPQTA